MTTPEYLQKGDKVAIVAPAGKVALEKVKSAAEMLESWGLIVEIAKHIFDNEFAFSSNDYNRLADFQNVLDAEDINAIFCARGGYGSVRIIDKLDFANFQKSPKWIVGFSDITVFHSHIHANFEIETIHGIMSAGLNPKSNEERESMDSLKNVLFGNPLIYQMRKTPLSRMGRAKGELVGGNLAILCSLIGSASDIDTENKILFIEEIGEYLYRIDRMMWTLRRVGKLAKMKGLIVGGFTDIPDKKSDFGKSVHEIILEITRDYDFPIWFDFPAGHQKNNQTLILGREVSMEVDKTMKLQF